MTTDRRSKRLNARWHTWRWLMLALAVFSASTHAASQVELLLSDGSKAYLELAAHFRAALNAACDEHCGGEPTLRITTVEDWQPTAPRDLLVAVGNQAALHGLVSQPKRLLYGLIPRSSWRNLQQLYPSPAGQASAVFLDQPLSRQFDLLSVVLRADQRRVGVLLGPESAHLLPALQRLADRRDITLVARQVQNAEEVGPAVEELVHHIDVLLAIPDPTVFNRDTLYGILLTSYGDRVPVVGYSQALTRAGAMVALYTDIPDMARELAMVSARQIAHGGDLPPPFPSKSFHIAINRNVARSLGYELPEQDVLERLIRSMGGSDASAQAAQ